MSSPSANAGLIDPTAFPITSTVPDVEGLWDTREVLQKFAARMTERFPVVKQRWQATVANDIYNTPEAGKVRPLMGRAETDAIAFSDAAEKAANILGPYTTQLTMAQVRIKAIETDAAAFRAAVINGVTVERTNWHEDGTTSMYLATVNWYDDPATVEKNAALHQLYNTELAAIQNAAIECSEAIHAIDAVPGSSQPAPWSADDLMSMHNPWGSSVPAPPARPTDVLKGVATVVGSWGPGIQALTGFSDDVSALDAWTNLGKSLAGAAVAFDIAGTALLTPGKDYNDVKADEFDWQKNLADDGEVVWANFFGGPDASTKQEVKDQWKENPFKASGMFATNLASVFLPVKAPVKPGPLKPGTVKVADKALDAVGFVQGGTDIVVAGSALSLHHGLNALSLIVDGPPKAGWGGKHTGPGQGIFHGSEGTRGPAHRGD